MTNFFKKMLFLLTHPSRGATQKRNRCLRIFSISTHTPLTGCNLLRLMVFYPIINFYSHTPHGVQRSLGLTKLYLVNFYSHTPHGVQPTCVIINNNIHNFYSHTPHGVQLQTPKIFNVFSDFYSHTPHGVQPTPTNVSIWRKKFLLTHPSRGATAK